MAAVASPSTQRAQPSTLLDLPDELILRIFCYLDSSDLSRTDRVCRRFHQIARDQTLWASLLQRMGGGRWSSLPNLRGVTFALSRVKERLESVNRCPRWESLISSRDRIEWRWGQIGEQNLIVVLHPPHLSVWSLPQKERLFSQEVGAACSLRLSSVDETLFALFRSGQTVVVWNVGSGTVEKRIEVGEAIAGTDLSNGELLIVGRSGAVSQGHFLSQERSQFQVGSNSPIDQIWRLGEELYLLRENRDLEGWNLGQQSRFWLVNLPLHGILSTVALIQNVGGKVFALSYWREERRHHLTLYHKGSTTSITTQWPMSATFAYPTFVSTGSGEIALWPNALRRGEPVHISLETGALSTAGAASRQLSHFTLCNSEGAANSTVDLSSGGELHPFVLPHSQLPTPLAGQGQGPSAGGVIITPGHYFIFQTKITVGPNGSSTLHIADLCDPRGLLPPPKQPFDWGRLFIPLVLVALVGSVVILWKYDPD